MLHSVDFVILIAYLFAMVAIGIACRGRQEDAGDYFTGGGFSRLFGSLLIGLSIAATYFSGISFLAYPSEIYSTGVAISLAVLLLPLCAVIVCGWFLPRYLSTGCHEPYEIIERRFGSSTRTAAALMFVLLRIAWMGTLIYAPTIAVMAAAQLPQSYFWPIVLTIGLTSTFYTSLGGIRGVIVTDAIQFVVIAVGLLWPIFHVATRLPVSLGDAWSYLGDLGHLEWIHLSTDLREPYTLGSLVFGLMTANIGMYIADQMSLQRYLASESVSAARRAFIFNTVGVMVVLVLLSLVGLSMTCWYGLVEGPAPPENADYVFPYFVATQLPTGGAGLILAAILAATMSSMTSGINALAGTLTLDFAVRGGWLNTPRQQLAFGRGASIAIGLAATGVAGLVGRLGSIFTITQATTGVFLGPLLACMTLSLVRIPIRTSSVNAGMVAGTFAGLFVVWTVGAWKLSSLWVAPTAAAVSFGVPLVVAAVDRFTRRSVDETGDD